MRKGSRVEWTTKGFNDKLWNLPCAEASMVLRAGVWDNEKVEDQRMEGPVGWDGCWS